MPNETGDLSLLLHVEDHALAAYLAGRVSFVRNKLPNRKLAHALHWAPRPVRDKVLQALYPLRRERVGQYLQLFADGWEPPTLEQVASAREMLLAPLRNLIEGTALVWAEGPQPQVVMPESIAAEAQCVLALPQELDPERATPDEMLAACVSLAEHYRRYRGDQLAALRAQKTHPLIGRILDISLSAEPDFRAAARTAITAFVAQRAAWLDLASAGLLALTRKEAPRRTAQRLAEQLGASGVTAETLLAEAAEIRRPAADMTLSELAVVLLSWKTVAHDQGVLALTDELDRVGGFLGYGLALAEISPFLPTGQRKALLHRRQRAMLERLRTNAAMFVEFCADLDEGESPLMTEKRLASFLADDPGD